MSYFRKAAPPSDLEDWPMASPGQPLTLAESQEPFGQFDRSTASFVWSGKPGRLAWPLSLLIILVLSSALWAGIIFAIRHLILIM